MRDHFNRLFDLFIYLTVRLFHCLLACLLPKLWRAESPPRPKIDTEPPQNGQYRKPAPRQGRRTECPGALFCVLIDSKKQPGCHGKRRPTRRYSQRRTWLPVLIPSPTLNDRPSAGVRRAENRTRYDATFSSGSTVAA